MFRDSAEIYPTLEAAQATAKATAARGEASLGVARTTAAALTEELWELWGDGRRLASAAERLAAVDRALADAPALVRSAGTVRLIASFVARHGAALERLAGDDAAPCSLTESERAVLAVAGKTLRLLGGAGLVEPDCAAALLARAVEAGEARGPQVSVARPVGCGGGVEMLLRALGAAPEDLARNAPVASVPPAAPSVDVALLGAAGPFAVAAVVEEEAAARMDAGDASVLVVAPDPTALAKLVAAPLAARGARIALRASVPFGATWTGKALAALARVMDDDRPVEAASDFLYNPLAGVEEATAYRLNRAWRSDRTLAGRDLLAPLMAEAPACALFLRLLRWLRDGAAAGAASLEGADGEAPGTGEGERAGRGNLADFAEQTRAALEETVRAARGLGPLEHSREAAAVATAVDLAAAASAMGGAACAEDLLADATVRLTAESAPRTRGTEEMTGGEASRADGAAAAAAAAAAATRPEGGPALADAPAFPAPLVEFASLDRLDSLVPGSYDAVVVADTTDAAFPASVSPAATDALAAKLGLPGTSLPLDAQRRRFAAAMTAARRRLALVSCQLTASSDEAYPAFVLDEFAEAMAADGRPLHPGPAQGEDDLPLTLGGGFGPVVGRVELPLVRRGHLEALRLADFIPTVREGGSTLPVLSPSALEKYLACPYSWFLESRIAPSPLDEEFGPVEKGSFMHAVFARFYDRLAREAAPAGASVRTAPETRGSWEPLAHEVFDEVLAEQPHLVPGEGRLVAVARTEQMEVGHLRAQFLASLERLSRFAEGFAVHGHERRIEVSDGTSFAGARIRGRVDRVDVDPSTGRFLVLDYKGAVGPEYAAGLSEEAEDVPVPQRIQALVYAQALRGSFEGMHAAGALYLGYRARTDTAFAAGAAAGSPFADEGFVGAASLVPMNFEAYLDAVEKAVRPAVAALMEGNIVPCPRSARACTWCPAVDCEWRLP